jgi:hypothetical protein
MLCHAAAGLSGVCAGHMLMRLVVQCAAACSNLLCSSWAVLQHSVVSVRARTRLMVCTAGAYLVDA